MKVEIVGKAEKDIRKLQKDMKQIEPYKKISFKELLDIIIKGWGER